MTLRRSFIAALSALLVFVGGSIALADDDPLSYSDPGMHFRPPDQWERVAVSTEGGDPSGPTPVALYVAKRGKLDQRYISITVQPFSGTLEGFLKNHNAEMRGQGDTSFVEKQEKTALSNSMPAYWLKISSGSTAGRFLRRYEYLVIDLTRAITVTYFGRSGDFDEKDAKEALSSLYVVVYPRRRP